jgi:hypothetical protein
MSLGRRVEESGGETGFVGLRLGRGEGRFLATSMSVNGGVPDCLVRERVRIGDGLDIGSNLKFFFKFMKVDSYYVIDHDVIRH